MSLLPPITVGKLQTALHTKAKNSPDYRFYALYDKMYRRDILERAIVRCRNNRGAPGVDGLGPISDPAALSIVWRAALGVLVASTSMRPFISLSCSSCSNDEPCRHGPCSSFRSSEERHAGFTTVVLGSLTRASFGVLPVGCLRALVVARVGVIGPKLASRLRAVSSGAFTRRVDTPRLARQNT
jgi:hypothetical protein